MMMANGGQTNWTAIAGAVAAVILAIVQSMQHVSIQDNHATTHERIDGIEQVIVPRNEIDNRFMSKSTIQSVQATHTSQISDIESDIRDLEDYHERELEKK